ncbi:hypothetical protein MKW94_006937 [Papaver nudicaule]|uniref:Uncharacterized protein n=1 Tax=Papaver nudicaule TaxID=74823 RepID=A0AA41W3A7_PAPNU|nr:hypothetical protein [Papaver nudicaule]
MRILVVGFPGTGKSTMLKILNGHKAEDSSDYTVQFDTNENMHVIFICSESFSNYITDGKYDGYMVVFSLSDVPSYKYAIGICEELICRKRIVLVANKDDLTGTSKRKIHHIPAGKELGIAQFVVSAETGSNIQKPFLSLAKYLLKIPTLSFVEAVPVKTPINKSLTAASLALPRAPIRPSDSLSAAFLAVPRAPIPPSDSLSAARLASTPRKRRERTLRIVGVGDEENEDISEFINNQRPSCCYN